MLSNAPNELVGGVSQFGDPAQLEKLTEEYSRLSAENRENGKKWTEHCTEYQKLK